MPSCSAVSNPPQPHGLWTTRLLCPWDFSGENTGVGCHFLLYLTQSRLHKKKKKKQPNSKSPKNPQYLKKLTWSHFARTHPFRLPSVKAYIIGNVIKCPLWSSRLKINIGKQYKPSTTTLSSKEILVCNRSLKIFIHKYDIQCLSKLYFYYLRIFSKILSFIQSKVWK